MIMLIVKGEDFDCIFGLEFGVDDYIVKLFNYRELLVCVKVIICCIEYINSLFN